MAHGRNGCHGLDTEIKYVKNNLCKSVASVSSVCHPSTLSLTAPSTTLRSPYNKPPWHAQGLAIRGYTRPCGQP